MTTNIEKLFEVDLNDKLRTDQSILADSTESFQLEVGSDTWHIDFSNAREVKKGAHAKPDCAISIPTPQFEKLIAGKLNIPLALATRKIKVRGNLGLIPKLVSLFK